MGNQRHCPVCGKFARRDGTCSDPECRTRQAQHEEASRLAQEQNTISLMQEKYFGCFDELALHAPVIVEKEPRFALWIKLPEVQGGHGGQSIGVSPDGQVYMAKAVYREPFSAEFPEFEKKLVGMQNQNFIVLGFLANDAVVKLFGQYLAPAWFSPEEMAAVSTTRDYKTLRSLKPYATGRFELGSAPRGDVVSCSTDALWLASRHGSVDKIKFTPGVELLFDNHASSIGGSPFQIWSDGVVTKLDSAFSAQSFVQPKFKLTKPVMFLLQHALRQKYWCDDKKYSKLFGIQSISGVDKIEQWEQSARGWGTSSSDEISLERWRTDVGDIWVVKHGWGSLGEDGDAGEDVDIFDDESMARKEFSDTIKACKGE
jgi:hypothetical protein